MRIIKIDLAEQTVLFSLPSELCDKLVNDASDEIRSALSKGLGIISLGGDGSEKQYEKQTPVADKDKQTKNKTSKQKKETKPDFTILSETGVTETSDNLVDENDSKKISFEDITKKMQAYIAKDKADASARVTTLRTIIKTGYKITNIKDLKPEDYASFFEKIPTLEK